MGKEWGEGRGVVTDKESFWNETIRSREKEKERETETGPKQRTH